MSRAHITCREIMRAIFTRVGRVFGGAVLIAALGRPQCIHPRAYIATAFSPHGGGYILSKHKVYRPLRVHQCLQAQFHHHAENRNRLTATGN
jgi:hypothetical protein